MSEAKTKFFACVFVGVLAAVFCSGIALTNDATITQSIGAAMIAWVVGFIFGANGFSE